MKKIIATDFFSMSPWSQKKLSEKTFKKIIIEEGWYNTMMGLKFVFSKKVTKIDEIFTVIWHLLHNVKSTVKILSIFVAFLATMNFIIVWMNETKNIQGW